MWSIMGLQADWIYKWVDILSLNQKSNVIAEMGHIKKKIKKEV